MRQPTRPAILATLATALSACLCVAAPDALTASSMPEYWPTCTTAAQERCVENLEYTDPQGSLTVLLRPGAPGEQDPAPTQPYVRVYAPPAAAVPSGAVALEMLNFEVVDPKNQVLGPGVYPGLPAGSYRFQLRLGGFDPSLTGLTAEPSSLSTTKDPDGTFTLDVTASPRPNISLTQGGFATCTAQAWSCTGEVGVRSALSGFLAQHPAPAERDAVRGSWIATSAASFSSPQVSIPNKTVSAAAAGPHFVPDTYPLEGLTLEDGKGLNPAFYVAYLPYTLLTAMLDKAPAELKTYLTPETVKAKITELGAQKDQPLTVQTGPAGVRVDLGLTHFSAPNPTITFLAPTSSTTTPPTTSPTSPRPTGVAVGRRVAARGYLKVPSGFRVTSVRVSPASKRVCLATGTSLKTLRSGRCSFSATVLKGRVKKTLKGSFTVS